MQNLTLPPQYQFMSVHSDAFGQTEVIIRVGIIDHAKITDQVNARLDEMEPTLASDATWVQVGRQMFMIDHWVDGMHKSVPDKLMVTVAYDADDHDAIMEALKPFDDLWEKV